VHDDGHVNVDGSGIWEACWCWLPCPLDAGVERSFRVGDAAWNKQSFRFTATATELRINFHCTSNTVFPKCCPLIDNVAVQVVNSIVIPIDSLLIPFIEPGIALPTEEISMKLDGLQSGWKYQATFYARDEACTNYGFVRIDQRSKTPFTADTSASGSGTPIPFYFTASKSQHDIIFYCRFVRYGCCPNIYGLLILPANS